MARKKFLRRLPSIRTIPPLKGKDHKTARLLEILRGIAVSAQKEEPQVFYALREIALHFRVPLSVVARVYSELENEGLLTSIRGSKTLLQGLTSGRHFSVLGFVGMPAALSAFVTLQDYRMVFIRTRRELRARGFAVAMTLFDPGRARTGQLLKRIQKHDFDTVIWYRPDESVREIIAQLRDTGVRIIGVSDGEISPIRCRYEVRREAAIAAILHDWHSRSAIKTAVVIRGARASSAKEQLLETLIEEESLNCEFVSVGSDSPGLFLEALGKREEQGIIFPSQVASMFAFREPEALMNLMKRCRVAFIGGPPSIPFARILDVPADLVIVDWQLIAERMVDDLISKTAFDAAETTTFQAQAQIRAPINQYAQGL